MPRLRNAMPSSGDKNNPRAINPHRQLPNFIFLNFLFARTLDSFQ
jgi:hypothetical protein